MNFFDGGFCYRPVIQNKDYDDYGSITSWDVKTYKLKIIGNRYENPKLLDVCHES